MFCLYPEYYFIDWPDSQKFADLDPDGEHTLPGGFAGLFAEKEWVDNLDDLHELP